MLTFFLSSFLTILVGAITGSVPSDFFDDQFISTSLDFFTWAGGIILAVSLAFMLFGVAERKAAGEYIDISTCFLNFLKAVVLLFLSRPAIVATFYMSRQAGLDLVSGVVNQAANITSPTGSFNLPAPNLNIFAWFGELGQAIAKQIQGSMVQFIVMIIMVGVSISLFFQLLKICGIFYIQIVSAYLYIADVMTGNSDSFLLWIRDVTANCVTFMLEFIFYIGGMADINAHSYSDLAKCMPGLACIIAAPFIPMALRQFGFNHGAAGSARNVVAGFGQAASAAVTALSHIG